MTTTIPTLTAGCNVNVNGRAFKVSHVGTTGAVVSLTGKRGGGWTLVQNIRSGRWYVLDTAGRETALTSIALA